MGGVVKVQTDWECESEHTSFDVQTFNYRTEMHGALNRNYQTFSKKKPKWQNLTKENTKLKNKTVTNVQCTSHWVCPY